MRIKQFLVFACSGLVLLSTSIEPADAQTPVVPCADSDERLEKIDQIILFYERISEQIEWVSPSDAEFLKTETEAAVADQNRARYGVVEANPLYKPWQVWKDLEEAVGPLKATRETPYVRLMVQSAAVSLSELDGFIAAVEEYRAFDATRSPSVAPDLKHLYFDTAVIRSNLVSLIACSVMSLPGQTDPEG